VLTHTPSPISTARSGSLLRTSRRQCCTGRRHGRAGERAGGGAASTCPRPRRLPQAGRRVGRVTPRLQAAPLPPTPARRLCSTGRGRAVPSRRLLLSGDAASLTSGPVRPPLEVAGLGLGKLTPLSNRGAFSEPLAGEPASLAYGATHALPVVETGEKACRYTRLCCAQAPAALLASTSSPETPRSGLLAFLSGA